MDNIIEQIVEVPVEQIVQKPVEHIVERPVYIDNIIEKKIPIEVIREEVIEKPVEHIIEKYVDNIIENPVAIEQRIDIPVANYLDVHIPVDYITPHTSNYVAEKPVPREVVTKRPVEYIITKMNPVAAENVVEIDVPQFNQQTHEKIIQKEVVIERVVERPVAIEKLIEVEVPREIERANYVEKVIEKQVQFDQVIEQKYEVLVPNVVEVQVEKQIIVPVKTTRTAPAENMNTFSRDILVDTNVTVPVQGKEFTEVDTEVTDEDLNRRIEQNRVNTNSILQANAQL